MIDIKIEPKEKFAFVELNLKGEPEKVHIELHNFQLNKQEEKCEDKFYITTKDIKVLPEKPWLQALLTTFLSKNEIDQKTFDFLQNFLDFEK